MTAARTILPVILFLLLCPVAEAAGPKRIVIAGSALAEIAFLLGAGDRVVAVDKHSTFPPETAGKAQIGYFRGLAAEPILALSPDALIVSPDAGPQVVLDQLAATGLPVHIAPAAQSPDQVPLKITFVGDVLGLPEEAGALSRSYAERLAEAEQSEARAAERPKVVFVMGLRGAPVVAGRDTIAHAMITMAGGLNAVADFPGYKPITEEALVGAAPEILLMMPDRLAAAGGKDALLSRHGLQHTPVGRSKHVVTMDGGLLLRLGPRTVEAINTLAEAFRSAPSAPK